MSIAVVQIRKEPFYRRNAVEVGLRKLGYAIDPVGTPRPKDKRDLLVLWTKKAGVEEQQADAWERNGGSVIVMENGYLQKVDKTYYAISAHGHNGSGWFPIGNEDRFSKLGFELKPWRETEGYRLICGQRSIGSASMASPPMWGEKLAERFKSMGVPHRFRKHPGNFASKTPLVDDLKGASVCTIWSSSAGVRALVEGVQVHHSAPNWVCAAGNGPVARTQALHRMAHAQWHHEEIATGEPFARILEDVDAIQWA